MASFSRDQITSLKAALQWRTGVFSGAGSSSRPGEDIDGHPTFYPGRDENPAEPSYRCDDVDVYCFMGCDAPAGRQFVRLRSILGSVEHLLPAGTVLWWRDGDQVYTRVQATKKEVTADEDHE